MRSWVWLGCDGFLWIVDFYGGLCWVTTVGVLGVVGLRWFFEDRGSLRWFVLGHCSGSVSGFCDFILVSFNFSGFD